MAQVRPQTNFTEQNADSVRRQFSLLDTDEDGLIYPQHLSNVLRSINLNITDTEIQHIMGKADVDGDGLITFDDFKAALTRARLEEQRMTAHERDAALRKTFQIFDRQNFGMIGPKEIWTVLKNLGKDFTLEEIEDMVDEVDNDGKSRITYPEFVQLILGE